MAHFEVLVQEAGMELTAEELEALKPLYDHYAAQISTLRELDLGASDMAVAYDPGSGIRHPEGR